MSPTTSFLYRVLGPGPRRPWAVALLCASLAGGLTACEQFLDVKPVDRVEDSGALASAQNVERILFAGYDGIQRDDFLGGQIQRIAELYAAEVSLQRAQADQFAAQFTNRSFAIFNGIGESSWAAGYSAIHKANLVIGAIDNRTFPATDLTRRTWRAEALFIRALAHFELVRHFALPYTADEGARPGIPLRTFAPTTEQASIRVPRSTVAQVYEQVIADLREAIDNAPVTNGSRINRTNCKALLARVYHNQNNFSEATRYANEAMSEGGLSLDTTAATILTPFRLTGEVPSAPTVAFQIVNVTGDDGSGNLRFAFWNPVPDQVFLPLNIRPSGVVPLLTSPAGGRRGTDLLVADATNPYSLKFASVGPLNVPVVRTAELILIRAESRLAAGDATGARADLNAIRTFNEAETVGVGVGGQDLQNLINEEFRMEFVVEGQWFHHLRRLRLNIPGWANNPAIPFNDPRHLLKIPNSELRGNPDIEQN